ncbi:MAG: hypothetical protein A2Z81_02925 [Omnitrophica WOR_2 bacterium GWA2_45_18]|nr:MAG: hypothetical protein A2Z81_02925 [Omnitrophica WOR_2 bacterium GWA2_45_18]
MKCKNVAGIKTTPIRQILSQRVAILSESALIINTENRLHHAIEREYIENVKFTGFLLFLQKINIDKIPNTIPVKKYDIVKFNR